MKFKNLIYLPIFFIAFNCTETKSTAQKARQEKKTSVQEITIKEIPPKNQLLVKAAKEFGPDISATYEKAVCTELVIQVLEKVQPLTKTDKRRIRIITNEDIQQLLNDNSNLPKGVYYALSEKVIGIPVSDQNEVQEGDLVQFWTETWGHCGIVKSIDPAKNEMELYSSFPSTNGYGIQKFPIPAHSFFVRLK